MKGLIGQKLGMTQIYDGKGRRIPVTAIGGGSCVVVQRKTKARDGYEAVQVGFGDCKESRMTKPELTRFKKAGLTPKRVLGEFHLEENDNPTVGDAITVAIFEKTDFVDVIGTTKGHGFAGVMKRHKMSGNRNSHGAHSKRRIGAIGQRAKPGRV